MVDGDGVIVLANERLSSLVGRAVDDLVGRPLEMLVPTAFRDQHRHDRERYHRDPTTRPMSDAQARVTVLHADGSLVPVEVGLSPITEDGERLTVAVIRDLRDRLAAESAQDAVRRSLDSIDHGVLMVDVASSTITYANAGATYHSGHQRSALLGQRFLDLIHADDRHAVATTMTTLTRGTIQSITQILRIVRRDGSQFPAEATFNRPTTEFGPHRPMVILLRNITERMAVEAERDRREKLLTALAEIRRVALAELGVEPVLDLVAATAVRQLDAREAFVATITPSGEIWCRAAAGGTDDRTGQGVPRGGLIDHVLGRGEAEVLAALAAGDPLEEARRRLDLVGPTLVVPLVAADAVPGVLVAARPPDQGPFGPSETAIATTLAAEAAVALVIDQVRRERHYLSVVEDRERIARDLHDLVIQRLFATGMALEGALNTPSGLLEERAAAAVEDLDETISVIRRSIFHLTQPDRSTLGTVERLIDRHRAVGRNDVELVTVGDLEALPDNLAAQLVPVLNELLSNIERHANATTANVRVDCGDEALEITVEDDGDGFEATETAGFGLRNLQARAELLGGTLAVASPRPSSDGLPSSESPGTLITWLVPRARPMATAHLDPEAG